MAVLKWFPTKRDKSTSADDVGGYKVSVENIPDTIVVRDEGCNINTSSVTIGNRVLAFNDDNGTLTIIKKE